MKKSLLAAMLLSHFWVTAQTITTLVGNGTSAYFGDGGPATAAAIHHPHGMAMDVAGNLYIADKFNNVIRKVNTTGIISTFAGTGVTGHSGDGGPATNAMLNNPHQLIMDVAGNLYFCEESNYVRRVDAAGNISSIAGNGTAAYTGDGGPATAATFDKPEGIAIDALGNMYIADCNNNVIRKISTSGIASTFAGVGWAGYSGDGGLATAAYMDHPAFLFIDHAGNLLVDDVGNNLIRKIDGAGIITTFAGTSLAPGADGIPATDGALYLPSGMAEDGNYNIYIAEASNNRVRMVDPSGIIHTVAGSGPFGASGSSGYSGDGGPATAAELNFPINVFLNNLGDLYVSDQNNSVIRKITLSPTYVADSFDIFVNNYCSGANIRVVVHNYFAGLSVKTWFGDGTTNTSPILANGSSPLLTHTYANSGTYSIKQILYSGSVAIDTFQFSYLYSLCNSLAVNLYNDLNTDCIHDSSENLLALSTTIEVDSNGLSIDTISATAGFFYNAHGSVGDVYAFRVLVPPSGFYPSCPASGIIYDTIAATGYSAAQCKNLAMNCIVSTGFDFRIYADITQTRPLEQIGGLFVSNGNCIPNNAVVTLHHSAKYSGTPSIVFPAPATTTSNTITWNISGLSSSDPIPNFLYYKLAPSGAPLIPGDTVYSYFTIDPHIGDSDTTNNSDDRVDTVKGSYDPNGIWVSPSNCIVSGAVPTQLKYTINFENTGNDTAHNIYVMDTLSDNVDVSSMRIIMSSHQMFVSKLRDAANHNILKFDFPKINLLDSSHHGKCDGAVIYTIKTKSALANGIDIPNRAGIYFDVNEVVMTNEVANVIGCGATNVDNSLTPAFIDIYPNPATDVLNIKMIDRRFHTFSINNMVGVVMVSGDLQGNVNKIDIQSLPAGIYFLSLRGVEGTETRKFVKW